MPNFTRTLWLIMAGPNCNILIPEWTTEKIKSTIDSLLSDKCRLKEANEFTWNFWMRLNHATSDYPIEVSIGDLSEYSSSELNTVKENFNLDPKSCLTITAGTNSPNSHILIAQTGITCASELNGIIDFNGTIKHELRESELIEIEGGHFGTHQFVSEWLSHKEFAMIK